MQRAYEDSHMARIIIDASSFFNLFMQMYMVYINERSDVAKRSPPHPLPRHTLFNKSWAGITVRSDHPCKTVPHGHSARKIPVLSPYLLQILADIHLRAHIHAPMPGCCSRKWFPLQLPHSAGTPAAPAGNKT